MKQVDLTKGNITLGLLKLALPIMGTSFIQMAYNMTDLIWIGRLGSQATTAIGTAGFFTWFAMGFITIPKVSAEALVSRAVGQKDENTSTIVETLIKFAILSGLIYGLIIFFGRSEFLKFFKLNNKTVISMAMDYSKIICFTYIFFFMNPILTAIFNAHGSSSTPFLFNMTGLIINIILDPILIFGLLGKANGVLGAAYATLIAQAVVTSLFAIHIVKNKDTLLFRHFKLFKRLDLYKLKEILRIGTPVGLQSMSFTIIAIFITRIIAEFGYIGIAVQKIGSQIEAITWMTASGFSAAISAFIGQNLGAKQYDRIHKGYKTAYFTILGIGIITSSILYFFAEPIFSIFLNETIALKEGTIYLIILSYSQAFMCMEIITNGAFYGLGKTIYPSLNSIIFTALRIPMAYVLSRFYGLAGIWWAVSITSMIKGVLITILYAKKAKPEKILEAA